jgi:TonB-dependent receptor
MTPLHEYIGKAGIVLAVSMAAYTGNAHSQEVPQPFNIPAGVAANSIPEFAKQAGINILASADILDGVTTNALVGTFVISEAVDRLLKGTNLIGRVGTSGTVVILKRPSGARDNASSESKMTEETTMMNIPSQRKATCCAVSAAVLMMGAPLAHGQAQDQAADPSQVQSATATTKAEPVSTVQVVGTRRSQQSSIDRKKNAATAIDSVVAEDVGSLPDRNVGEAISRIAGISLDRGDFGEGVTVAVRGNGPELTRVELDGQAVQSAGGTDMNGGGDGRGSEFRQLSADLIKSVDVVKGSTADMTEGSLGGGIQIKTRNGLDFKKPFASLRVAGTQSNLNKKWQPDANLILTKKFMNDRLGLLLNASHTVLDNEGHQARTSGGSSPNFQGYYRLFDFDNSPEKTFTFQPSTVNTADPSATSPMRPTNLTGTGTIYSSSPLELVTRSAAAQTKADCQAAFPALTTAQLNTIVSADRSIAQTQRTNELTTCLNQWTDYSPSGPQYQVRREIDKRQNLDLRADFKVNDELTVYAKGSYNKRHDDINTLTFSMGNFSVQNGSTNVQPGTAVVDANHYLTSYTFNNTNSNGVAKTGQSHGIGETTARYLQLGGSFKRGGFSAEWFVGDARSDFQQGIKNLTLNDYYGSGTLSVLPNGLWGYTFPGYDPTDNSSLERFAKLFPRGASGATNPSTYNPGRIPAYTAAQQNAVTSSPNLTWTPLIFFSEEKTAKVDLTWKTPDAIPFFKRFKGGYNLRDNRNDNWNLNITSSGYNVKNPVGTFGQPGYQPPIVIPQTRILSTMYGCQDSPGSLAPGGNACKYGFNPNTDIRTSMSGESVLPMDQFMDMLKQTMTLKATPTQFFSGAKDRPAGLVDNWTQIDVEKMYEILKIPHTDFSCVKQCMASDGKIYDNPAQHLKERTDSFYLMGDFGLDHIPFTERALPFGWELEGNLGVRYVKTKVSGIGMMTFTSLTKNANFDPAFPDAAAGKNTSSVTQATQTVAKTTDILPSLNLATWVMPDKLVLRYSIGKTVARPPVSRLLASGTCTYDEVKDEQGDDPMRCSGTVGNPALKAQKNVNQNMSLEWYPNKDTMFTIAGFRQQGKVGGAITQGVFDQPIFAGTNLVDPVTGNPLSEQLFDYTTWVNGTTTGRKGVEFSTKTAFTFLPWKLRYLGFDGNYSKMHSAATLANVRDLLTGDPLPPQNESKYTYNAAIWYDDGKLSARIALQAVAAYFNCLGACGSATSMLNYVNVGGGRLGPPFNPSSPNFTDSTRWIDGKISYKITPNVEVFAEGRNLGNASRSHSQYNKPFADGTPVLNDIAYPGRRIMVGINLRTLQ